MNDSGEVASALQGAGLEPATRSYPKTGRVEAVDVGGAASGWKASVSFDDDTGRSEW